MVLHLKLRHQVYFLFQRPTELLQPHEILLVVVQLQSVDTMKRKVMYKNNRIYAITYQSITYTTGTTTGKEVEPKFSSCCLYCGGQGFI